PPLAPSSFFFLSPFLSLLLRACRGPPPPTTPSLSSRPSSPAPAAAPPAPLFPGWPLLPAPLFSGRPLLSIARRGALLPGVEPPRAPPPVLTSLFPTPLARHRLGSSAALDRGPSPAASNSGGLELRRAGERAGPE
ncbi:unnamed protein product, partial [Urochloa humidicola]